MSKQPPSGGNRRKAKPNPDLKRVEFDKDSRDDDKPKGGFGEKKYTEKKDFEKRPPRGSKPVGAGKPFKSGTSKPGFSDESKGDKPKGIKPERKFKSDEDGPGKRPRVSKRSEDRPDYSDKPFKAGYSKPGFGGKSKGDKPGGFKPERKFKSGEGRFDKKPDRRGDDKPDYSGKPYKAGYSKPGFGGKSKGDKPGGFKPERKFKSGEGRFDKKPDRRGDDKPDYSGKPSYSDKPFKSGRSKSDYPSKSKDGKRGEMKSKFKPEEGRFEKKPFAKGKFDAKKPFGKGGKFKGGEKSRGAGRFKDAPANTKDDMVRLNRHIANSGVCSRREADELILAGKVKVNGKVVTELGTKISSRDKVTYDGKVLKAEKLQYVLLNKPKGFITTVSDERDRRTVMDLVREACKERIYPVGRLDRNTTGLLLLTNDGELAKRLTHPSYNIRKIYQVILDKPLSKEHFEQIAQGVTLEDGPIVPDEIAMVDDDATNIGIEIHSGRNRIVRRIFEHFGYQIETLDRVMLGNLTKKNLGRGKWRHLSPAEVSRL
jgi:23S rRNA pseudouridine2605 synthase